MSFGPVIPTGGIAGLRFLDRTFERQFELFNRDPVLNRDIEHFLKAAPGIETVEDLVTDTQALRVALGAFGLEEELPKRAFIRKILEEGSIDPRALANRLAAPAWADFAAALGFGDLGGRLGSDSLRQDLVERYRMRQFERAAGDVNVNMRLALNFRREIAEIATSDSVDTAGWFRVMGSRPLRTVMEKALGLPDQFGALDVDAQRGELARLARKRFGGETPAVFTDPAKVEEAIRVFLARAQAEAGPDPTTPGATALTILQSSALGPGASSNLFASRFL